MVRSGGGLAPTEHGRGLNAQMLPSRAGANEFLTQGSSSLQEARGEQCTHVDPAIIVVVGTALSVSPPTRFELQAPSTCVRQ
jgi:hypothetical protein